VERRQWYDQALSITQQLIRLARARGEKLEGKCAALDATLEDWKEQIPGPAKDYQTFSGNSIIMAGVLWVSRARNLRNDNLLRRKWH